MIFKFSQALVIGLVLLAFAWINKELTAQRVFLVVLYLLLASVFPWLMVPVGVVAIIWSLFKTPSITGYISSIGKGQTP